MLCVVMKPFVSSGEDFVRDQLVEGGEFRNVQVLLSQRFIRHATQDEINSAHYEEDATVDEEEEEEEDNTSTDSEDESDATETRPPRVKKTSLKAVAKKAKTVIKKKVKSLKAKARRR